MLPAPDNAHLYRSRRTGTGAAGMRREAVFNGALQQFTDRAPRRWSPGRHARRSPSPSSTRYDPRPARRRRRAAVLLPPAGVPGEARRPGAPVACASTSETRAWLCHRCGATGKLTERWEAPPPAPSVRDAAPPRPPCASIRVAPRAASPGRRPRRPCCRGCWPRCVPLGGTPGQRYLFGRGIGLGLALRAGVRFCPDVYGRPAVVFPMHDRTGELVAVNSATRTAGTTPRRTAWGTAAWACSPPPAVRVDPAPCPPGGRGGAAGRPLPGRLRVPAVALVGTGAPALAAPAAAFRRVLVGLDADAEGDWASELKPVD